MKGTALVIAANGDVTETPLAQPPDLEFLQAAVGGWIEAVPEFTTIEHKGALADCVVFCNETGKLEGLLVNPAATRLWDAALCRLKDGVTGQLLYPTGLVKDDRLMDHLVGSILVIIGDAELLGEL